MLFWKTCKSFPLEEYRQVEHYIEYILRLQFVTCASVWNIHKDIVTDFVQIFFFLPFSKNVTAALSTVRNMLNPQISSMNETTQFLLSKMLLGYEYTKNFMFERVKQ